MNYRHIYHAGNFSDIFKHLLLLNIVDHLLKKEAPFCFFETHAGAGLYDLFSAEADATREFESGVLRILGCTDAPPVVVRYRSWLLTLNKQVHFRYFPGTALCVKAHMRAQDRLILNELHPEEYKQLKQNLSKHPLSPRPFSSSEGERNTQTGASQQVHIHHADGYQMLKALLPPRERRGLVFIDPPYENIQELQHLIRSLEEAIQNWPTGIYAVWYPIKDPIYTQKIQKSLSVLQTSNVLEVKMRVFPEDLSFHLNGCGMRIINPPWGLEAKISEWLGWLEKKTTRSPMTQP
jgi:23S rRNA (adenine2030-N6)-methyltransferase